jgi:histidyl-tRNA synthetase
VIRHNINKKLTSWKCDQAQYQQEIEEGTRKMFEFPLDEAIAIDTETEVCIISIGETYEHSLKVSAELREMGVNVAFDITNRKTEKQLKEMMNRINSMK